MTSLILILLAILVLILLFAIATAAVILLDNIRQLIKTASLDYVQFYAALNQARLDNEIKQARLEYGREFAQWKIVEQRKKLTGVKK